MAKYSNKSNIELYQAAIKGEAGAFNALHAAALEGYDEETKRQQEQAIERGQESDALPECFYAKNPEAVYYLGKYIERNAPSTAAGHYYVAAISGERRAADALKGLEKKKVPVATFTLGLLYIYGDRNVVRTIPIRGIDLLGEAAKMGVAAAREALVECSQKKENGALATFAHAKLVQLDSPMQSRGGRG